MAQRSGKLIVGQSGGCTQVINASLQGVVEEARRHAEITAVWGLRHGIEGALRHAVVDLGAESPETLRRIGRTPSAALGSCRHKLRPDEPAKILAFFRRNDVRTFIYIGGNDSADTAHRLACAAAEARYDLRVFSVPKTIDNDLPLTDHTPGFGSAARFLATVTADTGMETAAMGSFEPVKVIESKGRNAGWLTAAAALAKRGELDAPQFVWPPEVPFEERRFLALTRQWLRRIGYCVIVAAETLRHRDGTPVAAKDPHARTDAFGHPRLEGAAEYLANLVQARLDVRARWDKPGSIQNMSSAHISAIDRREARLCGVWAVRFARRGLTDRMVTLCRRPGARYAVTCGSVPLAEIANVEKTLPAAFFDRRRMLPTAAYRRYALPLLGPGLPEHARLKSRQAAARPS